MSPKSKGRKKPVKHRDPRAQARQAAYEAARRSARRKWSVAAAVLVVILVLGLSQVIGGGGGDDTDLDSSATTVTTTPAGSRTPVSLPTPGKGASLTGDTPCPAADGSSSRTTSFAKAPPTCIVEGKSYVAEMATSKGLVTIALDAEASPIAVNNFVVLARYHYFDTLPFHRIVSGFVVQGGSPDATGGGSPGYQFADELPATNVYDLGTVAMANSGPNTNGSQFFIVSGDASFLKPSYSVLGEVTGGLDVVAAMDAAGTPQTDPNSGAPTEVVTIQSVTIKET